MSPMLRKYLLLAVVVVGFVALDYGTKQWAHATLASEEHPLPVIVTASEAGQPLAALVAARFPDLEEPADVTRDLVRRVDRGVRPTAGQNAFAALDQGGRPALPLAYVFFNEGWDVAPRVLLLVEKRFLRRWLGFVFSDRPRVEVDALVEKEFADATLAGYLAGHIAGVDEAGAAAAVEEGRVLPLFSHRLGVDPDREVAEGELYLLTERRVDVIPGLFRFDYKENPGAAWGLLATQGPKFRQVFLCGVSAIASLVILFIFIRLQDTHLSAILAFSAILSGAVGNLIDRLHYNYVIDFFDMYISYMHWPTYNVADIAISLGVVALVFEMLFVKSSPFAQAAAQRDDVEAGAAAIPADEGDGASDDDPEGGAAKAKEAGA